MYMGLRQFRSRIKQCAQKCRLWPLCFVLLICGCNRVNTADPLRNHYDELGVTMKNYFDEVLSRPLLPDGTRPAVYFKGFKEDKFETKKEETEDSELN